MPSSGACLPGRAADFLRKAPEPSPRPSRLPKRPGSDPSTGSHRSSAPFRSSRRCSRRDGARALPGVRVRNPAQPSGAGARREGACDPARPGAAPLRGGKLAADPRRRVAPPPSGRRPGGRGAPAALPRTGISRACAHLDRRGARDVGRGVAPRVRRRETLCGSGSRSGSRSGRRARGHRRSGSASRARLSGGMAARGLGSLRKPRRLGAVLRKTVGGRGSAPSSSALAHPGRARRQVLGRVRSRPHGRRAASSGSLRSRALGAVRRAPDAARTRPRGARPGSAHRASARGGPDGGRDAGSRELGGGIPEPAGGRVVFPCRASRCAPRGVRRRLAGLARGDRSREGDRRRAAGRSEAAARARRPGPGRGCRAPPQEPAADGRNRGHAGPTGRGRAASGGVAPDASGSAGRRSGASPASRRHRVLARRPRGLRARAPRRGRAARSRPARRRRRRNRARPSAGARAGGPPRGRLGRLRFRAAGRARRGRRRARRAIPLSGGARPARPPGARASDRPFRGSDCGFRGGSCGARGADSRSFRRAVPLRAIGRVREGSRERARGGGLRRTRGSSSHRPGQPRRASGEPMRLGRGGVGDRGAREERARRDETICACWSRCTTGAGWPCGGDFSPTPHARTRKPVGSPTPSRTGSRSASCGSKRAIADSTRATSTPRSRRGSWPRRRLRIGATGSGSPGSVSPRRPGASPAVRRPPPGTRSKVCSRATRMAPPRRWHGGLDSFRMRRSPRAGATARRDASGSPAAPSWPRASSVRLPPSFRAIRFGPCAPR